VPDELQPSEREERRASAGRVAFQEAHQIGQAGSALLAAPEKPRAVAAEPALAQIGNHCEQMRLVHALCSFLRVKRHTLLLLFLLRLRFRFHASNGQLASAPQQPLPSMLRCTHVCTSGMVVKALAIARSSSSSVGLHIVPGTASSMLLAP
jgi:hypothetical protein